MRAGQRRDRARTPSCSGRRGDLGALVGAAAAREVDLVVVGPEAPLVAGLADALRAAGIALLRAPARPPPRSRAPRRSPRRSWPTPACPRPAYAVVHDRGGRPGRDRRLPDGDQGRRAGRGQGRDHRRATRREARDALTRCSSSSASARPPCVVEEFLAGEELSLLALCDGEPGRAHGPGAGLQAHRRRRHRGPNTGGMGSYSPVAGRRRGAGGRDLRRGPPAGARRAARGAERRSTACSTPA